MNSDSLVRRSVSDDEHVLVGGCNGLVLLRRDELSAYNQGYLLAMAAALAVGLVELLLWLAL